MESKFFVLHKLITRAAGEPSAEEAPSLYNFVMKHSLREQQQDCHMIFNCFFIIIIIIIFQFFYVITGQVHFKSNICCEKYIKKEY